MGKNRVIKIEDFDMLPGISFIIAFTALECTKYLGFILRILLGVIS